MNRGERNRSRHGGKEVAEYGVLHGVLHSMCGREGSGDVTSTLRRGVSDGS